MRTRSCRICGRELENLYYASFDTGDAFYVCECGATNQLRRPPGKEPVKFPNEWRKNQGTVSVKDVPPREHAGGYHLGRHHRDAKKVDEPVLQEEHEVDLLEV